MLDDTTGTNASGPFSWVIKGFWLLALVLAGVEWYHTIGYLREIDRIGEQYTATLGFLLTLGFRTAFLFALLCLSAVVSFYYRTKREVSIDAERMENGGFNSNIGTIPEHYKPPTTLREFAGHFMRLFPFMWPHGANAWKLQLLILACVIIMIFGRMVNLWVPIQYKKVVDSLGGGWSVYLLNGQVPDMPTEIPYNAIFMFVFLRLLSSSVGILSTMQSALWIPVGQVGWFRLTLKNFVEVGTDVTRVVDLVHNAGDFGPHVRTSSQVSIWFCSSVNSRIAPHVRPFQSLALRFHLNRKTGEILRVQGTNS